MGPSEETELLWEGRLATQAEDIDGKTYITGFAEGTPQPGDFGEIRITRASDYDLFGFVESIRPRNAVNLLAPAGSQTAALPILQ